jgi:hypothetical protein
MELIVGAFLLVAVSLVGHIGLVVGSYFRPSTPAVEA